MKINDIWQAVAMELKKAKKKHPNWPDHICGKAGIVVEETGELMQACVQLKYEVGKDKDSQAAQLVKIETEAIHVIATAIRFLENLKQG